MSKERIQRLCLGCRSRGNLSFGSAIFWLIFVVFGTLMSGRKVGASYWGDGATTLEWTVASPPPFHTFEEPPVLANAAAHPAE